MLTRLHKLKCDYEKANQESFFTQEDNQRHFGIFSQEEKQSSPVKSDKSDKPDKRVSSESSQGNHSGGSDNPQETTSQAQTSPRKEGIKSETKSRRETMKRALSPSYYSDDLYRFKRGRVREDSISKCLSYNVYKTYSFHKWKVIIYWCLEKLCDYVLFLVCQIQCLFS